jgi:hypothetical protein
MTQSRWDWEIRHERFAALAGSFDASGRNWIFEEQKPGCLLGVIQ